MNQPIAWSRVGRRSFKRAELARTKRHDVIERWVAMNLHNSLRCIADDDYPDRCDWKSSRRFFVAAAFRVTTHRPISLSNLVRRSLGKTNTLPVSQRFPFPAFTILPLELHIIVIVAKWRDFAECCAKFIDLLRCDHSSLVSRERRELVMQRNNFLDILIFF